MTLHNDPSNQHESSSPDLFSSLETRAMLQEFRDLVRSGILRVTPENEVLSVKAPAAGEGAGKRAPEGSREEDVALLDKQLLEWIARRRQHRAEEPKRPEVSDWPVPERNAQSNEAGPDGLRQKVVERLAQTILSIWDRNDTLSAGHESLREQVADRLAKDILRRWQSRPE